MQRLGSTIAFAAGLAIASPALVLAADKTANTPAHIEVTSDGPLLVSTTGMTLYTNAADRNGQSTCSNKVEVPKPRTLPGGEPARESPERIWVSQPCTAKWTPYAAGANAQPVGDFGLVDRPEGGAKQWTFKGQPLYTSQKDEKPGDHWGATYQFVTDNAVVGAGGRGGQPGGGGGGRFGGGAFRYATLPLNDFPPTLRLARYDDDLVVALTNGTPLFTPKKGARTKGDDELLKPVLAAAMAKVGGDWSVVTTGDGRQQYAFRGKPLYAMPDGVHVADVLELDGWDAVVYQKGTGRPAQIEMRLSLAGDVYTTKAGQTLYQFNCGGGLGGGSALGCDGPGDPAGYWVAICGTPKECSERWKPYLAPANAKAAGQWTVVDVAFPIFTDPHGVTYPADAPRVKAWAYRGKPVFTYYEDKDAGDIWGHNVRWGFGGSSMVALLVPGRSNDRGG